MVRNRVYYILAFAAVFLFFLCFDGYLSYYSFFVILLLPAASAVMSLPHLFLLKIRLNSALAAARKGDPIPVTITASTPVPYPCGRVQLTFTARNTLTGETQTEELFFVVGFKDVTVDHELSSSVCGQVILTIDRVRLWDYMGLFPLPVRLNEENEKKVTFYPTVYFPELSVERVTMHDGEGDRHSQLKSGDDPSEIFAFRDYREGDRLSQIHWKLSQKTGDLLVREMGLPISDRIFFLLELNGKGRAADTLLDLFATLSNFLAQNEVPHQAGFCRGDGEPLSLWEIIRSEDALPVIDALLETGSSPLSPRLAKGELPSSVSHAMYLCCKPDMGTLESLQSEMPNTRITVLLATVSNNDDVDVPVGVSVLKIAPDEITEALHGFKI